MFRKRDILETAPGAGNDALARLAVLLFASSALLRIAAWGEPPPKRDLAWASDVRPALESVICVKVKSHEGKPYFEPVIAKPLECPRPLPQDPLLAGAAEILAERGVLMRARAGAPSAVFGTLEVTSSNQPEAESRYRDLVLKSPEVLLRVMPRVHQLLLKSGATCSDCPGPKAFPEAPRRVACSELMPYVVAYFWPVGVGPDAAVSMQICSGINGLDRIPHLDTALASAGFDLAFGNWEAAKVAIRLARESSRAAECKELAPAERVSCVHERLGRMLGEDPDFRKALAPRFVMMPEIGILCTDCGTAPAKPISVVSKDAAWRF